jgi:ribosome-binding factor A
MKRLPTIRQRRVAELVREELAQILEFEVEDPRLRGITVTDVEMTGDLRLAKVYFTTIGGEEEYEETFVALEKARGFLRTTLAARVRLRYVPDLEFFRDDLLDQARRIDELIEKIHREEPRSQE